MNPRRKRSRRVELERHFNAVYSRFKLWISFLDDNNAHFFEYEARESILQIEFRKVQTVTLDHAKGYHALTELLHRYRGLYRTAVIYDMYGTSRGPDDTLTRGRPIEKYNQDGSVERFVNIADLQMTTKAVILRNDDNNTWRLKSIKEPIEA